MKMVSFALTQMLLVAGAIYQSPPAEYQQNSAQIALTLNGHQGDAYAPASDVAWIGGSASVTLEVSGQPTGVTLLAYEAEELVSRNQGAFVTSAGQLINLAMGPSLVTADITGAISNGVFHLPIPTSLPGIFALQALVTDASHPDGFRLSAPVILQVTVPTHTYLQGAVDLATLSSNAIDVVAVHGISYNDELALGEAPSTLVNGVATLTSATVGTMTQAVVIDGTLGQIRVGGVPVTTLHDLFPVGVAESGVLELTCEAPVSVTVSNMYLAPLALTTYKTDKGRVIPTGPYPFPTLTSAQALAKIEEQSPGLTSRITEVAAPDPDYWCHSFVFLPPGVEKGIWGHWVDVILRDNNYYRSDAVPFIVRPGDVVVYRDAQGNVLHTGVVTETDGVNATKVAASGAAMASTTMRQGTFRRVTSRPGARWNTGRQPGQAVTRSKTRSRPNTDTRIYWHPPVMPRTIVACSW
jgi:hypothetical protein